MTYYNSLIGKTSDTSKRAEKIEQNRLKMCRNMRGALRRLEKQLRFINVDRFGGKKGGLTRAFEEALKKWIVK